MPQDPDAPIAEASAQAVSKWRGLGVTLGGMTAVIAVVVITVIISSTGPTPVSSVAAPGGAVRPASAASGDASAKYNQQVVRENKQHVVQAAATGESFVATPVGSTEPANPIHAADSVRADSELLRRPPSATVDLPQASNRLEPAASHNLGDPHQEEAVRSSIDQYLSHLDQAWRLTVPVRQVGHSEGALPSDASRSEPATPRASPAMLSEDQQDLATPTTVRVGDVLYAENEYVVNSDIGTRAVARVLAGDLQGAKLIGQFKLASDYLVLEYDRLVLRDGTVLTVQGMAIDPAANQMFIRTAIDRHILSRWGGFLGSVFLAAYGQKLEQSGETTVVTTGSGGTTTVTQQPQYDSRTISEIALGRMAAEVAGEMRKGLSRPATVRLKAHADLGVLILAAPSRAQQLREARQGG
jgi:hypothetical protein